MDWEYFLADQGSSIQAAGNMETSRPERPTERKKSDNMDSKSRGAAGDIQTLTCPHCEKQFPAETKEEEMAEDEDEWKKILRELKSSEIKDCVPCAEELKKKIQSLHSDVLKFFTDVNSLPPKKPETGSQRSWSLFQLPQALWRGRVKTPADSTSLHLKVIYSCVVTGETFGADNTILEKVENNWTSLIWMERTENVQRCDIIIVFCPIITRIGSDVEAVKKHAAVSSNNKPVIVVLMHHTIDEEFSPGERKWFEDPRFGLEVHVLYHETQRGLLQCPHNDQAVSKIQQKLHRHSKTRWSSS